MEDKCKPIKKLKLATLEDNKEVKSLEKLDGNQDNQDASQDLKTQNEEKERFQEIFKRVPPEVWDLIFDTFTNPKDKLAVLNTCSVWNQVLEGKRTTFLFPLVLTHLSSYLPTATFLNLRQLSKHHKNCIESSLNSLSKFDSHWFANDGPISPIWNNLQRPYIFDKPEKIDTFLSKMGTHQTPNPHNPFITKTISIKYPSGQAAFQNMYQTSLKLLNTFGSHVSDFTHFCPELSRDMEIFVVTTLPAVLKTLPNLKILKVDWNSDGVLQVSPALVNFLQNEDLFPPLPQLTHLNFDFRGGGELELLLGIKLFRCYGSQLQSLVIRGDFFGNPGIPSQLIMDLVPNLKNLRIFCVTRNSLTTLHEIGAAIRLERLQLWYSFHTIEFQHFVRAISPFSETLTQLHMDIKLDYRTIRNFGEGEGEDENRAVQGNGIFPGRGLLNEFAKLTRLSAPVSSVHASWFWEMVKSKFKNLEQVELQAVMEQLFAPYEKKHLKREIKKGKDLFKYLDKLGKIRYWFHNDRECFLVSRPGKREMGLLDE